MPFNDELRIVSPPSMATLAAEGIREQIVSGVLRPGERLREVPLSEELGVSRPPLREALQMLAQEGIVDLLPRRGAKVRGLTVQDAYEIVTLRRSLERFALALALPVRDAAALRPLAEALQTLEDHAAAGLEERAVADTMNFHVVLVDLGGHALLGDTYRRLTARIRMCMNANRRFRADSESLQARAQRHRELFDAIRSGDSDVVRALIEDDASLSFLPALSNSLPLATPAATQWYRKAIASLSG
ncbi:GntR family transcriptional regulator [Microbacterium sp. cx-55]|uniref:GntR family transcriptional regulator n=1 Tax=Microbacterium sp. cx-55 TaxID=2875948 RepID=UPI001CC14636|nr:GntR family transcriptional regulator [Microbacterium sp. cx-55]MBZ4486729.1 GntR family transcriptional regulator [Microbacterium sp. cx-55]UGB36313.1 GntR family transcriptional regulator [Microbacterium sp. cx-55]